MSYRIGQDFEFVGNDYWRWWAWVDASDSDLDQVKQVTWILHPTFKQSRITIIDRAKKFELRTAGWGTFQLKAEITTKNGETHVVKHNLRLQYPSKTTSENRDRGDDCAASAKPLTVYLSFGMADARAASTVRDDLWRAGIEVLDQTSVAPGAEFNNAVKQMLTKCDAVLSLVGEEDISPWVRSDLDKAIEFGKPAFAFVPPGGVIRGIPSQVQTFEVDVKDWAASSVTALHSTEKIDKA